MKKLSNEADTYVWKWGKGGKFSVKSLHGQLVMVNDGDSFTRTWKAKISYKIKIFLWVVENGAILTKDNVIHHVNSARRRKPLPICCLNVLWLE